MERMTLRRSQHKLGILFVFGLAQSNQTACNPSQVYRPPAVSSSSTEEEQMKVLCHSLSMSVVQLTGRASYSAEPLETSNEAVQISKKASALCLEEEPLWYYFLRFSELGHTEFPYRNGVQEFASLGSLAASAATRFPSSHRIAMANARINGLDSSSIVQNEKDQEMVLVQRARMLASNAQTSSTPGKASARAIFTDVVEALEKVHHLEKVPGGGALLAWARFNLGDYEGAISASRLRQDPTFLLYEPISFEDQIEYQRRQFEIRGQSELAKENGNKELAQLFLDAAKEDASEEERVNALAYDIKEIAPEFQEGSLGQLGRNQLPALQSSMPASAEYSLINDPGVTVSRVADSYYPYLEFNPGATELPVNRRISSGKSCRQEVNKQQDLVTESFQSLKTAELRQAFQAEHPGLQLPLIGTLSIHLTPSDTEKTKVMGGPPFSCVHARHRWAYSTPNTTYEPFYMLSEAVPYQTRAWATSVFPWDTPLEVDVTAGEKAPKFEEDFPNSGNLVNIGGRATIYFKKDGIRTNASGVMIGRSTWPQFCAKKRWDPNRYPGLGLLTYGPLCDKLEQKILKEQEAARKEHRKRRPVAELDLTEAEVQQIQDAVILGLLIDPLTRTVDGTYKANDFGKLALKVLHANGERTGMLVHPTGTAERYAEMIASGKISDDLLKRNYQLLMLFSTFSYSHGCIHIAPFVRDSWLKQSFLKKGMRLKILPYKYVPKVASK